MLKIIRLKTGDELLADIDVVNEHATIDDLKQPNTTINKPLILGVIPKEEKIVFLDLLLYADHKKITVKTNDIVFIVEPKDELKDKHKDFWEEKDSNIITSENKIIS